MGTLLHCNVQSEYVLLWSPLTQGYIDCYNLTFPGSPKMSSSGFVTLRKHCTVAAKGPAFSQPDRWTMICETLDTEHIGQLNNDEFWPQRKAVEFTKQHLCHRPAI